MRVQPEPLERGDRVPHLDDGRPRPVRRDMDREVGVVHDEQPRRAQVVHPTDQADQVADLAREPVAVGLQEQHHATVGMSRADGRIDVGEIALEDRHPGRREHDPVAAEREQTESGAHDPQDDTGEHVLETAHARAQACWRTMMFWPSSVRSSSRIRLAMTSATALGCMILDGSSSGARMRRSSVAVRPGEML